MRDVRLRAFADAPLAFGTTVAEASARPPGWWDARAAACAQGPASALCVAETVARWCGLVGAESAGVLGDVEVISMWVDPSGRRRGLGRWLLDTTAVWASEQGAVALQLRVTEGNVLAIRLYEACGFIFTGEAQPHPSQIGLRELCMRHALNMKME